MMQGWHVGQWSFHQKPESDPFKNNHTKTVLCSKNPLSYNEVSLPIAFPSSPQFASIYEVPEYSQQCKKKPQKTNTQKQVPKRPS